MSFKNESQGIVFQVGSLACTVLTGDELLVVSLEWESRLVSSCQEVTLLSVRNGIQRLYCLVGR